MKKTDISQAWCRILPPACGTNMSSMEARRTPTRHHATNRLGRMVGRKLWIPARFEWSDDAWRGIKLERQVIYEMHIGTFTPAGTWLGAAEKLEYLRDTGVTLIEVMPVADFPGKFGWGYDGVQLYAPASIYGTPEDMRAFVDRAHSVGLGVILDVVYNHLGPDGNYLTKFSPFYFTTRYKTDWGEAINFDGEECGPVREFFRENAAFLDSRISFGRLTCRCDPRHP